MYNFKDLNIKPNVNSFTGDKISIQKLLKIQIKVLDFKINPSKQKQDTEYLTLQIEKSGEKRIVFSGSGVLIDQIKRVPKDKFPFVTTIVKDNDYCEFT